LLLRACLKKDPRERLSSIGDLRLLLNEPDVAGPAVLTLVVAKNGPKLHELKDGEPPILQAMAATVDGRRTMYIPLRGRDKPGTLSKFAAILSGRLGRPVLDRTELKGIYDTSLNLGELVDGNDVPAAGRSTCPPKASRRLALGSAEVS
jgi:uncharacterized protein (TIGR03435 family)